MFLDELIVVSRLCNVIDYCNNKFLLLLIRKNVEKIEINIHSKPSLCALLSLTFCIFKQLNFNR